MESLEDVIQKRFSRSLVEFLKLIDPQRTFRIDEQLGKTWDGLTLTDQRKLYLYLLYRKWRGIDIYGEPYYIIRNCHPVPFNWNEHPAVDFLIQTNRARIAKYNGSFGTYTYDEANVYGMTEIQRFKKDSSFSGVCQTPL